ATVVPSAPPVVTVPYCQVNFTFSGASGPSSGYLPGQSQQITIRVGLPLSAADGGTDGVQGAWNGKQRDLGGTAYVGFIAPVTDATNGRYVGTFTDTGHTSDQLVPFLDGSFALNPDNTLNVGLIEDFAIDGIHQQRVWGATIAERYYGMAPTRHYW